jgi:hypothetical protein
MAALKTQVVQNFAGGTDPLSVLPVQFGAGGISGYVFMPLVTLAVFLSVQWWAAWYPGAEPGGGGYVAQRIFSSAPSATACWRRCSSRSRTTPPSVAVDRHRPRDDRHVPQPRSRREGKGYVMAYMELLPSPWRGLMLAGFAAAYMSTVATQLNWGRRTW